MIKKCIERLRENDALDLPQMSALTLHHLQAAAAVCYLLSLLHLFTTITAQDDGWRSATATYSNDTDGSIITGGACGFGDLHRTTYGRYSAGLSAILFNKGSTCGACFEVRCVDHSQLCLRGSPTIVLTATDFCPPNYGLPGDHGGWCNFPRSHFQMSQPAFSEIAYRESNIIQIHYRRVKCDRNGGIRFTLNGSAYFMQVLITNVGLDGEIVAVKVKGTRTGWIPMGRNWGQNWQCNIDLTGQPLSFEVTTVSKVTLASYSVAPTNWRFGQTFQGKQF